MSDQPRFRRLERTPDRAHLDYHGAPVVTTVLGAADRWIAWRAASETRKGRSGTGLPARVAGGVTASPLALLAVALTVATAVGFAI